MDRIEENQLNSFLLNSCKKYMENFAGLYLILLDAQMQQTVQTETRVRTMCDIVQQAGCGPMTLL